MSHLCRTFVCLLSYFLIYGIMAYLCALTPFVCDDFGYWPYSDAQMSFRFGLDHFWRFHTIHWQTVNGRTIAHLIVQFGILWKPLLHVFLTPLIFCLMLSLGQYLIWGDSRRIFANFISPPCSSSAASGSSLQYSALITFGELARETICIPLRLYSSSFVHAGNGWQLRLGAQIHS